MMSSLLTIHVPVEYLSYRKRRSLWLVKRVCQKLTTHICRFVKKRPKPRSKCRPKPRLQPAWGRRPDPRTYTPKFFPRAYPDFRAASCCFHPHFPGSPQASDSVLRNLMPPPLEPGRVKETTQSAPKIHCITYLTLMEWRDNRTMAQTQVGRTRLQRSLKKFWTKSWRCNFSYKL